MDRLEELRNWLQSAPLGTKFPLRIDGLGHGVAEVSMDVQMGDLVSAGEVMIVQGGILAVLADTAAVLAAMSILPAGHTPLVRMSYDIRSSSTLVDFRLMANAQVRLQDQKMIWVEVLVYGMSAAQAGGDNLKAVFMAQFAKPKLACLP